MNCTFPTRLILIATLFLCCTWSVAANALPAPQRNKTSAPDSLPALYTPAEKIFALSEIRSELKYNFVHYDQLDFDPDSLFLATIPLAARTRNDVEFFDLLDRYLARFGDPHTRVAATTFDRYAVYRLAPVRFQWIDGKYYLSMMLESSGLPETSLGAELVEVNGIPVNRYVQDEIFPRIPASDERLKYTLAADRLGTGLPGTPFSGTFRLRDGNLLPFSLTCNLTARELMGGPVRYIPGAGKPRNRRVTLDWADKRIAWLDIMQLADEDIPAIDSLLDIVDRKADGLIIDLRYCRGGSSTVGQKLLERIVRADYYLSEKWQTRKANAYGRSQGNYRPEYEDYYLDRAYETYAPDTLPIDRSRTLRCPVVILTSGYTASACETFLVQLYEIPGRPTIMGERTQGTTGAPLMIDLPHDAMAIVCTRRIFFPYSGKPFTPDGIRPDIEIGLTAEDEYRSYDRPLEKAVEYLKHNK